MIANLAFSLGQGVLVAPFCPAETSEIPVERAETKALHLHRPRRGKGRPKGVPNGLTWGLIRDAIAAAKEPIPFGDLRKATGIDANVISQSLHNHADELDRQGEPRRYRYQLRSVA